MKIAAYIDINYSSGGALYQSTGAANILNKVKSKNFTIEFCCSSSETQKYFEIIGIKSKLFNKGSFFNRLNLFLFKLRIIKKIYKFFKIDNVFEKFIKKNNFDLVVFIDPSQLAIYCENINFIFNVWEMAHKKLSFFPEYNDNAFELKDKLYQYVANKSHKIIVDCKKSKFEFIKYYNCDHDKVRILPLMPNIIFKETINNSDKPLKKFKSVNLNKCFFFPAQFWAHKNHAYIVDALAYLKDQGINDYNCIFTGRDRGALQFIKSKIIKLNLVNNFIIHEYLSEEEIIYLYQNCFSLILPTFVGSTSLPLYESFYFNKRIIYNSSILDDDVKDKVINLDIKNKKNLFQIIKRIENKDSEFDNIKKKAKDYIDNELNEKSLIKRYNEILEEFHYYLTRYR